MKNILLATHYTPTQGPMDKLETYFRKKKSTITLVQFPLSLSDDLPIKITTTAESKTFKLPSKLQYVLEGIAAAMTYQFQFVNKNKHDLAVCGDPLAFLHIFMFKWIYKVEKMVYFNVDFSEHRYNNKMLNSIYQAVNKFAYKNSDYFFYLNKDILSFIDPLKKHTYKTFLVTHWINQSAINHSAKKIPNSFIFAGNLGYAVEFSQLLNALKQLKDENIPFIMDIYGSGPQESELAEKIKELDLQTSVKLQGVLDNKTLVTKIFPQYNIGLCPYILQGTGSHPDHMFKVSELTTKLVEYIAAGLPIVTTRLSFAFDKIEKNKFGFLVKSEKDWYNAVKKLLSDKKIYELYAGNAYAFASHYDEEAILTPIFNQII